MCVLICVKGSNSISELLRTVLICLLVFFVPLENFSLVWRCHHYQWGAANFLYLALMAIEQRDFLRLPHLLGAPLWHGTFKDLWYTHLLSSVQQWSCHYLFQQLCNNCCSWDSNTQPSKWKCSKWLNHCRSRTVLMQKNKLWCQTLIE